MRDIEEYLDKIIELLKEELNEKIDDINAQKADGIELQHIDENAYILESLDTSTINFDNFIFIQTVEKDSITNGDSLATNYDVDMIFFLGFENEDRDLNKVIKRYHKAMKKAVKDIWMRINQEVSIQSVSPYTVKDEDTSTVHKIFGLTIGLTIFEEE